jgi:excisionase family DNA binding protein
MKHQPDISTNSNGGSPSLLITLDELARMMGVSKRTIARRSADGSIPRPVRIGGATRWRRHEVEAWIDAGCPSPSRWQYGGRKAR